MPTRDSSRPIAAPIVRPVVRPLVRPLDYTAMRMLTFRTALTDFLRRWGVYFAIVVLLFSAGSNAPVTIAAALAGTLVWPLRIAAAHGAALIPTTLAYAALGTLPVMLTRPLWWPRRWASAEHALPLAGDVIRRSDRLFALLMMTPWQAVLLIGGIGAWLNDDAGHAAADRWCALGGWAVSMLVAGAFACFVVAALTASPVRPQVGVLYGMVVGAGCVLEAFTPPAMSPSDHAARWSLMLVAAIAFASEISP